MPMRRSVPNSKGKSAPASDSETRGCVSQDGRARAESPVSDRDRDTLPNQQLPPTHAEADRGERRHQGSVVSSTPPHGRYSLAAALAERRASPDAAFEARNDGLVHDADPGDRARRWAQSQETEPSGAFCGGICGGSFNGLDRRLSSDFFNLAAIVDPADGTSFGTSLKEVANLLRYDSQRSTDAAHMASRRKR
jgi:hypothetical protein